jgi:hypothetical protein
MSRARAFQKRPPPDNRIFYERNERNVTARNDGRAVRRYVYMIIQLSGQIDFVICRSRARTTSIRQLYKAVSRATRERTFQLVHFVDSVYVGVESAGKAQE